MTCRLYIYLFATPWTISLTDLSPINLKMESSLKTRLLSLLVVVPVLCLIIGVVLRKQARNETHDIQMAKRELKSEFTAEIEKLHNEVENLNKQKREMQTQIESHNVQLQQQQQQLRKDVDKFHTEKREMQSQLESDKIQLRHQIKTDKDAFDQQLKVITDSVSLVDREKRGSKAVGGAVYVRWGRVDCPYTAELVYAGLAGGSYYTHTGGAVNLMCMTHKPVWAKYGSNANYFSYLYGTEYELPSGDYPLGHGKTEYLNNHDVPCSVCRSTTRPSAIMIPGTTQCESGWTTEYSGYLMAGYHAHAAATEYNCIDANPDAHESGATNDNGRLLYRVKAKCGALPCPPYVDMREVTCVVCTK